MADSAQARRAAEAVGRVLGVPAARARVSPILGGVEARSFAVVVGSVRTFAKLPAESAGLTLGPEVEHALLERVAAQGLAPRPLGRDPATGVIVSELAESARALEARDLEDTAVLEAVARALRTLHALSEPLRPFAPIEFARHYAALARAPERAAAQHMLAEIEGIATRHAPLFVGGAVCHNDLHGGNILIEDTAEGRRVLLTDFEYAVTAAPLVDLASLAALNALSPERVAALLRAYHGGAAETDIGGLAAIVRIHELVAALWKLARNDNNEAESAMRDERGKGND
jgi:thiamine kinase-like enzyme